MQIQKTHSALLFKSPCSIFQERDLAFFIAVRYPEMVFAFEFTREHEWYIFTFCFTWEAPKHLQNPSLIHSTSTLSTLFLTFQSFFSKILVLPLYSSPTLAHPVNQYPSSEGGMDQYWEGPQGRRSSKIWTEIHKNLVCASILLYPILAHPSL